MDRKLFTLAFFLLTTVIYSDSERTAVPLKRGQGSDVLYFDFGETAPTSSLTVERLQEPKLEDLKLGFLEPAPGYYNGPDGGEVYQWAKNHYQWKRADGSVYTEWVNGTFKLDFPSGVGFTSVPQSCNGCSPTLVWNYPDLTKITKYWMAHRKEYDFTYQKPLNFENYLLVKESQFGKPKLELGNYVLYGSEKWSEYIRAFGGNFKIKPFLQYVKSEFSLENRGKVPVLLFDEYEDIKKYIGADIPGGSEEGGFGGRDSITMCCGDKMPQATGNPEFDADALRRFHFGVFYHEAVHNLEQISCLKIQSETGKTPQTDILDPWFEEGLANYVEAKFYERKQFHIYNDAEKLIRENKVPKTFKALLDAKYRDLLPYSIGPLLIKHIHETYGKEAIISYQKDTCVGTSPALALQNATGVSPDQILKDSLSRFEKEKDLFLKDGKKLQLAGYTVMNSKFPLELKTFLDKGFSLPESALEIKSYTELPSLQKIFPANVESYSGKLEGDFLGPNSSYFYLWKKGNYRWYGDSWEANVFPGNQILFRGSGFTLIEWEDGKKQYISPKGDSVIFFSLESKSYLNADGKPVTP
ncbi:peptidase MA family protein [Leptospira congkakensis]|uniref:Peptidase MA family protein n=1 Tax=Leptospira congkakensis TaxID=2484932 RepID=A0A4Z1A5M9_9LEPT|nr:peptidase MA family protein [Leptospira congkakensis]TGL87293.1 peptidase MA family protein [Leptospira congkakensis]TGL96859.1 peptidase MA family protein [Leptospira congkakensis]TGL97710.1 peptidase MA family protein [Leptospira congkakensis]